MPGPEISKTDTNTHSTGVTRHAAGIVPPAEASGGAAPRSRTWVWVVLLLGVAVAGMVAYRSHENTQAAAKSRNAQLPAVSVAVASVQKRDVPYYLTGLGSVLAYNTVTVKTRVDGQIMRVNFKEGQFVNEGDVLLEIDPRPFQVALDQAQGQLAKDVASQQDAKIDLSRYTTLWQQGVIPRQQLDTQVATVGQFDGAIQADKAAIENQKLQLTYAKVTAPISGRVGLRLVDPGNIVHATDATGMIVITQIQPISVVFTIPEDNLPEVVAQEKRGELKVDAYSRDDKIKIAEGKLLTIDNMIDPTTGTIKLKSVFENKDASLWPNQFVNVRLYLSTRKDAHTVSSATLQRGTQGTFVYVVNQENQAQVRNVNVDFIEGNLAVVKQGLDPGEQVVVEGQDKLKDGAQVQPHPATTVQQLTADGQPGADQAAPAVGLPNSGAAAPATAHANGPGSRAKSHNSAGAAPGGQSSEQQKREGQKK